MKPKRYYSYPGCPKLTDRRYCPEHQQKVNSNYEKYGRDKSTKKRYGRAWKRIRDKYAAEHPFCERVLSVELSCLLKRFTTSCR